MGPLRHGKGPIEAHMTEAALQLIRGGKDGDDRVSLRELYGKYGGSVMGRCRYLLKDSTRAEDAMHDVFAKALQHHGEFRSQASPLTWLMKIATHHCLNQLRAERAGWFAKVVRDGKAAEEGHGGVETMEARDTVRRLLARFDLETQAAAVHYFVDEMTLEEVARTLGRSVPTIRKRLQAFSETSGKALRP
jgi:RNA polymerase sigma-70 factor, ECF subfamily